MKIENYKKSKNRNGVVNYEFSELKKLKTNKEPMDYYKTRIQNPYGRDFLNRSIILNFSEGKTHGCRFNCNYCHWKDNPLTKQRLYPSDEAINEFLDGFKGNCVTLSGGGDPLYNFKKNKNELVSLINKINERGFLVEIMTKEFENAIKFEQEKLVSKWSFSSQTMNELLLNVIERVNLCRVTCVYDENTMDTQFLNDYISYYKCANKIVIREDLKKNQFDDNDLFINIINNLWDENRDRVRILRNHDTINSHLFLIGDTITNVLEF
jgi:organic radical activating enzyme